MSDLRIDHRDQYLPATLYSPAIPNGHGVLNIHGWRSSRATAANYLPALAAEGFAALAFDLPGMGESVERLEDQTLDNYLAAVLTAFDLLANKPELDTIHLVGSSFGGYLAALTLAQRRVESAVLRVPADFPDEVKDQSGESLSAAIDNHTGRLPLIGDPQTKAQQAVSNFRGPVLVVESEFDDVVPSNTVGRYLKSRTDAQHYVMKGAPHSLSTHEHWEEFRNVVGAFFTSSGQPRT